MEAQFGTLILINFEMNQKRFNIVRQYVYETGSMTGILGQLKWGSLKKRRKNNRLILLYKCLKGTARIPTDDLIPRLGGGMAQRLGRRISDQGVPGSNPGRCTFRCGLEQVTFTLLSTGWTQEAVDGRPTWTDCDEAGDYVVPNVLSPRNLVFRPDNMDETVPHTHIPRLGAAEIRTLWLFRYPLLVKTPTPIRKASSIGL